MLTFGNTYLNFGGTYLTGVKINYNPLNLPPNTIRVRTSNGNAPYGSYTSATLVPGTSDVYDVYKSGTDFRFIFDNSRNLVEVLGANTSNSTNMGLMFTDCSNLTAVALFDTSNVTNMNQMFSNCAALQSIPLFDTSKVTNMSYMFRYCYKVESGALALYQQASTQTNVPSHSLCFNECGKNTQTGAAELAQIPSDWK